MVPPWVWGPGHNPEPVTPRPPEVPHATGPSCFLHSDCTLTHAHAREGSCWQLYVHATCKTDSHRSPPSSPGAPAPGNPPPSRSFIVYRARCAYSGGVVVLKGYSRESLTLQTRQRVFSEVSLLQRAQCPFILKCFDSFEDQVRATTTRCDRPHCSRCPAFHPRAHAEGWELATERQNPCVLPREVHPSRDRVRSFAPRVSTPPSV